MEMPSSSPESKATETLSKVKTTAARVRDRVAGSGEPVGTVNVVDPSPLNWLYITYNTVVSDRRSGPVGHRSVHPH